MYLSARDRAWRGVSSTAVDEREDEPLAVVERQRSQTVKRQHHPRDAIESYALRAVRDGHAAKRDSRFGFGGKR